MPRLIDHDQRRAELAEAVWRVVLDHGVGAASVRAVAAEAGVSTGSLRHVLPSKGLMLAAAMELVIERATARFLARTDEAHTPASAARWLGELLPMDSERRGEMEINLALVAEAAAHDELQGLRAESFAAVRNGCRTVLQHCAAAGSLREGLDLEAETTRLHVLVDGLAFHLVGASHTTHAETAMELLEEHLAGRWRY